MQINRLSITTGGSSGIAAAGNGLFAQNLGAGALMITAGGDVSGGNAGIYAGSLGSSIGIDVSGFVHNAGGAAGDRAIVTTGGAASITSSGRITGTLTLSEFADSVTNAGRWETAGDSNFAEGEDELINAPGGLIAAGGTAGVADETQFLGLERFANAGTISMVDQNGFDGSSAPDHLIVSGDYEGRDGTLALDVSLSGVKSAADVLTVEGSTSGTTSIILNQTQPGAGAPDPNGTLLVEVKGDSEAGNFTLKDGPINSGLYLYDLIYDTGDAGAQFLLVGLPGQGSVELPAVVSGAQNIFFDTSQNWVDRQNQLRDRQSRRNIVVAVADPPVEAQADQAGLWFTVRGTGTERDASASVSGFGRRYTFDTGYDQSTFSMMGGADFGTAFGSGTLLFGALGGYFNSSADLNASRTDIGYEGGSIGAYATYLAGGFFADVLGKADIFGVDYDTGDGNSSGNGVSWGLRSDAGYRFSSGAAYVEPLASVAAVWTSIDDFRLSGAAVRAGTNDAVQVGAGARIGWQTAGLDVMLTGRVWDALGDGNTISIAPPSATPDSVTDASFTGAFGEVSAQIQYAVTSQTDVHLSGSYLFGSDQTTVTGAAGVSYSW